MVDSSDSRYFYRHQPTAYCLLSRNQKETIVSLSLALHDSQKLLLIVKSIHLAFAPNAG